MFIKIRLPGKSEPASRIARRSGYPIRSTSFVASLGVHATVISLLVTASVADRASEKPSSRELVRPNERKIILYDFRRKPPDVDSVKKVGTSPKPRGAEVSKLTVIATSPKPASKEQFIWLPAPKMELQKDLPAPNLVAQLNVSIPAPPKPSPRTFVPPPPTEQQTRLPLPTPVLVSPAPELNIAAAPLRPSPDARAPALPAPPAPATNPGNASADIAIANLHPADANPNELPTGQRPGQFSKAPEQGKAATGNIGESGLTVPGLTVRGEKPETPKVPEPPPSRAIVYAERLRSVQISTVSVPLRPSSRSIPRLIDSRFQGRNVYTMVIPIENIPAYGGDWIIWFAEQTPVAGQAPLMRAPVPFRKMEPLDQPSPSHTVERVQIAAILGKEGKLAQVSVLSRNTPAVTQNAVQDLMSWEFKPATRDGAPVNVDVVIEIPFNLP